MARQCDQRLFLANMPNVDVVVFTTTRNEAFIHAAEARVYSVVHLADSLEDPDQAFVT